MGGVGQVSASMWRLVGERERIMLFVGSVVFVFVFAGFMFVDAGAQVVSRGKRRREEERIVRMMVEGLRRCIFLDEVVH